MPGIDHTKSIVELKNVCFSYGTDEVIQNVSLAIHKGDYLGIIGPNGGGKTTILKLIVGLLSPTKGSVLLYGNSIRQFYAYSKIGYISQNVTHIDDRFPMTVEEVVSMGRIAKKGLFQTHTTDDKKQIKNALLEVGMWDYRNTLIGQLSGGQKQRVFIARALAGNPEFIVLDEPTTGVDIHTEKKFYELLRKLNVKLGITLILVSHELEVVAREATEIAYMNRSLIYWGIPSKFKTSAYFKKFAGTE